MFFLIHGIRCLSRSVFFFLFIYCCIFPYPHIGVLDLNIFEGRLILGDKVPSRTGFMVPCGYISQLMVSFNDFYNARSICHRHYRRYEVLCAIMSLSGSPVFFFFWMHVISTASDFSFPLCPFDSLSLSLSLSLSISFIL